MRRRAVGNVGQPYNGLAAGSDFRKHLKEFQACLHLADLACNGCRDGVDPYVLVGYAHLVEPVNQVYGEHTALVDITRHPLNPPEKAYDLRVKFLHQRQNLFQPFRLEGNRIDKSPPFAYLEAGFGGVGIGGIERKGTGGHFLDRLDEPRHELSPCFTGRSYIEVEIINARRVLILRHFLDGRGLPFFHGRTDGLGHDVNIFTHKNHIFLTDCSPVHRYPEYLHRIQHALFQNQAVFRFFRKGGM